MFRASVNGPLIAAGILYLSSYLFCTSLHAQSAITQGRVVGTVTDSSGAEVA